MMLKPHRIRIHLGLDKPVRILQITDPHLSFADERDGEAGILRAAARRNTFFKEAEFPERDPVGYLEEAMEYSKNFDCTVITGDVLDLVYQGCEDVAKKLLAGKDYIFCAGNHEYCKVGTPEIFPNQPMLREEVQSCFRGDMAFESRIVGGVNVVAADNGFVLWRREMLPLLQAEVAKGLPILLFCHCPLNDRMRTYEYDREKFLAMGATEEEIELSRKILDYIAEEPLIKATFAGHYHFNATESIGGKTTYILGGLFKGIVGEITVD